MLCPGTATGTTDWGSDRSWLQDELRGETTTILTAILIDRHGQAPSGKHLASWAPVQRAERHTTAGILENLSGLCKRSPVEILSTAHLHQLGPALIETPLVLLGDSVSGHPGHAIIGIRQPQAHLVIIGIAPGNNPLAGRRGVVPVLHVILLSHSRRTGIAHSVVAHDIFDFLGRIPVHQEPAPGLSLQRAARVPDGDRTWLSGQVGHTREHRAHQTQQACSLPQAPLPLLVAVLEVGFDAGSVAVARGIRHILEQELRSRSDPLQGWQCELSALEDEAPLELPPGALLVETFAFHNERRHEA